MSMNTCGGSYNFLFYFLNQPWRDLHVLTRPSSCRRLCSVELHAINSPVTVHGPSAIAADKGLWPWTSTSLSRKRGPTTVWVVRVLQVQAGYDFNQFWNDREDSGWLWIISLGLCRHKFPLGSSVGGDRFETDGGVVLCVQLPIHTPSIAFRHLPPNSARICYATEGTLFISAQLSTDAVSALRKVWVLIMLNKTRGNETCPPRVKRKRRKSSVSIQTILVLFVLA